MDRTQPQPPSQYNIIPDFCRGESIRLIVITMVALASVIGLVASLSPGYTRIHFFWTVIHLQWMGAISTALLCWTRSLLKLARLKIVFGVSWGMIVAMSLIAADVAWAVADNVSAIPHPQGSRLKFLLVNAGITGVVALMMLRYFFVSSQLKAIAQADSEARYLALQARIRPHFLFNALNSIASLIVTKPEVAEEMVMDLADLFRVSLSKSSRLVTVKEEVEFVKTYVRIERVRLGEKLWVNWDISPAAEEGRLPLLILQPLVENAVHHGVSRLVGRGGIDVSIKRELGELFVDVENPIPPETAAEHKGTGVAMENIVARLRHIYGERAQLQQGPHKTDAGMVYRARIRVPYKPDIQMGLPNDAEPEY